MRERSRKSAEYSENNDLSIYQNLASIVQRTNGTYLPQSALSGERAHYRIPEQAAAVF